MKSRKSVFVNDQLHDRLKRVAVDLKTSVKQVVEWGMDSWLNDLGETDPKHVDPKQPEQPS